jgi:hypothetical protein
MIQARQETLRLEIHKLNKLMWNKKELLHLWKKSIVLLIHKKDDRTDHSNYRGVSLLSPSYKILSNILSRLKPYADEIIRITKVGFNITDQRPITFSTLGKYWRKVGVEW